MEAGRETGSLCRPLATAEAAALGSLRVVPVRGPAMGLSLAGPSGVGLWLRVLRWLVCVDPVTRSVSRTARLSTGDSAGAPGLFRVEADTALLGSEDATPGSRACVRVRARLGRVGRAGLQGAFWCASAFLLPLLVRSLFAWPPPGWGRPFSFYARPLSLPGVPWALASFCALSPPGFLFWFFSFCLLCPLFFVFFVFCFRRLFFLFFFVRPRCPWRFMFSGPGCLGPWRLVVPPPLPPFLFFFPSHFLLVCFFFLLFLGFLVFVFLCLLCGAGVVCVSWAVGCAGVCFVGAVPVIALCAVLPHPSGGGWCCLLCLGVCCWAWLSSVVSWWVLVSCFGCAVPVWPRGPPPCGLVWCVLVFRCPVLCSVALCCRVVVCCRALLFVCVVACACCLSPAAAHLLCVFWGIVLCILCRLRPVPCCAALCWCPCLCCPCPLCCFWCLVLLVPGVAACLVADCS